MSTVLVTVRIAGKRRLPGRVILPPGVVPKNPPFRSEDDNVPRLAMVVKSQALKIGANRDGEMIPPNLARGNLSHLRFFRRGPSCACGLVRIFKKSSCGHREMTIFEHPLRYSDFPVEKVSIMMIHVLGNEFLEGGQGQVFSGRIWPVVSNNAGRAHGRFRVGIMMQHLLLLPLSICCPPIRHIHHYDGMNALPKFFCLPLLDGSPPDVTELGRVAMVKFLRRVRPILPLEPARIAAVVRYRGPVQRVELLLRLFHPECVEQSHGGRDCKEQEGPHRRSTEMSK
mmetsp:Transcript_35861/g.80607  ORF Transcript_35861/g.80607 Transcript_35861/m.80607 type:complete len:284 (-) Transcript_35861:94-945(-)